MGAGSSNPVPKQQSKILPASKAGESGIYRSIYAKDPTPGDDGLVATLQNGAVQTLYDNFKFGAGRAAEQPCLGHRRFADGAFHEYVFETYAQVQTRVKNIGSGLLRLGLVKNDCIGLFSQNNAYWTISDIACASYSFVSVPLYDTLGPNTVAFIGQQAEIKAIICSKDKLKIVKEAATACPALKTVVVMEGADAADVEFFKGRGIQCYSFPEVEGLGVASPHEPIPPQPDDIYTICYTSGTTGNPKGAVLTQKTSSPTLLVSLTTSTAENPTSAACPLTLETITSLTCLPPMCSRESCKTLSLVMVVPLASTRAMSSSLWTTSLCCVPPSSPLFLASLTDSMTRSLELFAKQVAPRRSSSRRALLPRDRTSRTVS